MVSCSRLTLTRALASPPKPLIRHHPHIHLLPTMASTPPPVIGKAGNLTVFITPPATPSPVDTPRSRSLESTRSELSTPNATPRAAASPASPPPEQPATPLPVKTASPSSPTLVTPPPVKTVSPPPPAAKLSSPRPPPVQVPPPQFEKAGARPDGSVFAFFWDAVVRVQEAHASLDEYISNWFGLDQSKYQWALNDYYESTGKEMDLGKVGEPKELSCKMQKV